MAAVVVTSGRGICARVLVCVLSQVRGNLFGVQVADWGSRYLFGAGSGLDCVCGSPRRGCLWDGGDVSVGRVSVSWCRFVVVTQVLV